jgi:hypothetical protein
MKLLGYSGENEPNFDNLPGMTPVGVSSFGSNGERACMGDAELVDRGANWSRRGRVQLHTGGWCALAEIHRKVSIVPAFESSRALNTLDCRSESSRVHDRESGERSYV